MRGPPLLSALLQAYDAADAFLAALQPHILADEVPSPAPEVVQVGLDSFTLRSHDIGCHMHEDSQQAIAQLLLASLAIIHTIQAVGSF